MLSTILLAATLCIADRKEILTEGKCTNVDATVIGVAPADRDRLFLWTSTDAKSAQVGVIAAKAEKIELESSDRRELQLSITPNVETTFTLVGKEAWRWVMPAKTITRLERIFVPAGSYGVQLEAEHHRLFRRRPIVASEKTTHVGALNLVPLPVARGTVVDAKGKPVAGATIAFEDGTPCADANEQGAFTCELPEKVRAEVLVVRAAGFAANEVKLPPARSQTDIDLGRITLTSGRPLLIKITRPDAEKPARVTLFLDSPTRYEHSKLGTREVTEREQEVKFDNVGEGKYLVVVEGSEPLEKLEVPVEVKADETASKDITIEPFRVEGMVRFGEDALQKGSLEIVAQEHTWRESLDVSEGKFSATMWQHGRVSAWVKILESAELVQSPDLGDDPSRWDIRIERRLITGRVFDAETRERVPGAQLDIVADFGDGRAYSAGKIKEDGSYEVLANKAGTYMLKVKSPEHVAREIEVKIAAADTTRTVHIPLERGIVQPLEIVTSTGAPVANAMILEGVQDDRVNPRHIFSADASGRFELRGTAGETRLLYVVPQSGSFAVVRVQIPRSRDRVKPMQVVIAPPSSSLRVRTVDKDSKPVAALLLIRYNGEFLPGAIARFVTHDWLGTDASGEVVLSRFPAGTYEIWALAGERDEVALINSGGTLRSPERVGLSAGEQVVTLIAPEREPRPRKPPAN